MLATIFFLFLGVLFSALSAFGDLNAFEAANQAWKNQAQILPMLMGLLKVMFFFGVVGAVPYFFSNFFYNKVGIDITFAQIVIWAVIVLGVTAFREKIYSDPINALLAVVAVICIITLQYRFEG